MRKMWSELEGNSRCWRQERFDGRTQGAGGAKKRRGPGLKCFGLMLTAGAADRQKEDRLSAAWVGLKTWSTAACEFLKEEVND